MACLDILQKEKLFSLRRIWNDMNVLGGLKYCSPIMLLFTKYIKYLL